MTADQGSVTISRLSLLLKPDIWQMAGLFPGWKTKTPALQAGVDSDAVIYCLSAAGAAGAVLPVSSILRAPLKRCFQ